MMVRPTTPGSKSLKVNPKSNLHRKHRSDDEVTLLDVVRMAVVVLSAVVVMPATAAYRIFVYFFKTYIIDSY